MQNISEITSVPLKWNTSEIEKEKIYYFLIVSHNRGSVIIAKSPTGNSEAKKYLGYEWSNSRGKEGIQYLHMKKASNNEEFSLTSFTKEIKTTPLENNIPLSKFRLVRLQQLIGTIEGPTTKIDTSQILTEGKFPVITQDRNQYSLGYYNSNPITDLPLILFGDHSCVFKYVDTPFVRGADGTQLIKCKSDEIQLKYLYYYLRTIKVPNAHRYERHYKYLKRLYIPMPDKDTQIAIIKECDEIMRSVTQATDLKESLSKRLKELFRSYSSVVSLLGDNIDIITTRIPYSSIPCDHYISTENLLSQCRGYNPYSGSPITTSIIEFKKNDILLSNIRPYLEKMILASFDGGCSPDVLVLRCKNKKQISPKFLYYLLANTGFFDHIMTDIKGMKMPRGKIDTIKRFRIFLPENYSIQDRIAKEAEKICIDIKECDNLIENSNEKISEIVNRYII